jgi:ATP-dependent protease ClpP protease subunit
VNLPEIRMRNVRRIQALAGPQGKSMACRIVRNDAGPARLDVYDDIGAGGWFGGGISAADVVAQLAEITGDVEVHINSGGGDVFDGIAIYNALNARSGVTIVVDGIAASIASVIAQAGQSRVIAPGAMMMIHDALSLCIGNAGDMRETADLLDQVSNNLASIYAARGGTVEDWRAAMQAETWYGAQDAVDAGLMDKLAERPAAQADVANHDFTVFAHLPRWVADQIADGAQPHGPMTGTHSHPHPAYGSQGSDASHDHEHSHDGDAAHGHGHGAPADRSARVLGAESMPLLDGPIPVHHTATTDAAWDGPAAVAAMPNDDTVLRYCHAWETEAAADTPHREGDDDADDQKSNYKFPHHTEKGGPANLAACRNGLARLSGASIPSGDDAGVRAHLQAHLDDAQKGESSDHYHPEVAAAVVGFAQLLREGIK